MLYLYRVVDPGAGQRLAADARHFVLGAGWWHDGCAVLLNPSIKHQSKLNTLILIRMGSELCGVGFEAHSRSESFYNYFVMMRW